jgi:hypothetical protein
MHATGTDFNLIILLLHIDSLLTEAWYVHFAAEITIDVDFPLGRGVAKLEMKKRTLLVW